MAPKKKTPRRKTPKRKHKGTAGGRTAARGDGALRQHVLSLLRGGGAHLTFDKAVEGLPAAVRGTRPAGLGFTPWQLLEHMRITLWDIVEFCRDGKHVSPSFPQGYWPTADAPTDAAAWEKSLGAVRSHMKAMEDLVKDPRTDLFAKIPHGDGQTVLREALVIADHNSYHLGQLILLRRGLGAWGD